MFDVSIFAGLRDIGHRLGPSAEGPTLVRHQAQSPRMVRARLLTGNFCMTTGA